MKLIKFGITTLCMCVFSMQTSAKPTHDYFSTDIQFSSDTPLPENYLGFEIGDWHVSPAALTGYMHQLAAQSPRVSIDTIGYSHERNALNHVYISSPENIANLDAVLKQHQDAKSGKADILVINLAYSVHGNEASGANASPLAAYYYAASQEASVIQLLKNTVIIIEPSQNPDGLARYASWANQHKGVTANYDNAHRDHNERWPSGRTNHYWFDLNRDWIFTVHPESKARIKAYQKWRPQVLGDYHEMGGNIPSYFFQPGHPKRTHPNTPKENQRITFELAKFHAEALDARKQPYFTEERFDDFYYGKASAYPDATGSIGVLFEQSSIRGHNRELGGIKSNFSEGIANHLATSLSLVKGSDANRKDILDYTFKYRKGQFQKALVDPVKAYVFADDNDPARAQHFLDLLARHNIPAHAIDSTFMVGQVSFKKGHAWIIKTNGPQYGLVKSLFETRTSFEDETFYDISSWNIPLAFNLPYAPLSNTFRLGTRVTAPITPLAPKVWDSENTPVAYALEWNQFKAPHLLQTLLENDLHPRVSVQSFSSHTLENKTHDFKAGTIIIQPKKDHEHTTMQALLKAYPDVVIYGLSSGLTVKGPDLGSNEMKVIEKIRPALLIGKGVNAVEAGSMRYSVDNRFGIALTLLDLDRVANTDLRDYTHILIVDGTYKSWKKIPEKLETWVKAGGTIIAQKRAALWLEETIVFAESDEKNKPNKKDKGSNKADSKDDESRSVYNGYEEDRGRRRISGATLRAKADLTHPLLFGFNRTHIPVFYNARKAISAAKISYDTPLIFAKQELLMTGYADKKQIKKLEGTPVIAVHRVGKGKIVAVNTDANFRAFWIGTERLFANTLFFTQAIDSRKDEG